VTPDMTRVVLADNIRAYRHLRRLHQANIGERMHQAGHSTWHQVTVSEIECNRRNVTVPELVSITEILGVTIDQLLNPAGPN